MSSDAQIFVVLMILLAWLIQTLVWMRVTLALIDRVKAPVQEKDQ